MLEPGSKCPECSEGLMQPLIDTTEVTPHAIKTSLRVRCERCGHEDQAKLEPKG